MSLFIFLLLGRRFSKSLIVSNRIGKKFGNAGLQVNTRQVFGLTSYFQDIGHDLRNG